MQKRQRNRASIHLKKDGEEICIRLRLDPYSEMGKERENSEKKEERGCSTSQSSEDLVNRHGQEGTLSAFVVRERRNERQRKMKPSPEDSKSGLGRVVLECTVPEIYSLDR